MKLRKIENRILKINNTLSDKQREKDMARGIPMPVFEGILKNANQPLLDEKLQLETERQFILDRREGLVWKIIWNVIVPIVVSIITVYVLSKSGLS